ncbi:MAG: hypothetical protein F7C37_06205 [Desulfurococcales archaeon]|nr:hypothetical protein [Desulfurococcales archaeon]
MASLVDFLEVDPGTLIRPYVDKGVPVEMWRLQRAFPRCRYPYGTMVWLLLREAGLRPRSVIDLTYGLGKFWSCYRPRRIIAYDIRRLDWVVEPDEFYQKPAWAALYKYPYGVDLVAVDPPWQRCEKGNGCHGRRMAVGGAWWFRVSRAVGTPELILDTAARVAGSLGVPVLVHYEKPWVPPGFVELVSVWWRPSLLRAREGYATWWGVLASRR